MSEAWHIAGSRIYASADKQAPLIAHCPKEHEGRHGLSRSERDANMCLIADAKITRRHLDDLFLAARTVIEYWEHGDLASAVASLEVECDHIQAFRTPASKAA